LGDFDGLRMGSPTMIPCGASAASKGLIPLYRALPARAGNRPRPCARARPHGERRRLSVLEEATDREQSASRTGSRAIARDHHQAPAAERELAAIGCDRGFDSDTTKGNCHDQ
jgi:hypothetical protein